MNLTKNNLQEWKALLDQEMEKQHKIKKFSETLRDEDWLESYIGESVQNTINEEMFWSAQN